MTLRSINVYPIKGMKGSSVEYARVERRGLQFDRRWMLVDESGIFLSQRKVAKMARFVPVLQAPGLQISFDGHEPLTVDLVAPGAVKEVWVWKSLVNALSYPSHVDEWFSDALGQRCSLVQMGPNTVRSINPEFSQIGDEVSFADGYPVTLASEASLQDLNSKLAQPVGMDRFRPNLVFSGAAEPWMEEAWTRVQVGAVDFRVSKPCGRCIVTTIDQDTGTSSGAEPLRTLASYRQKASSADFSIHMIPDFEGHIKVGDPIQIH